MGNTHPPYVALKNLLLVSKNKNKNLYEQVPTFYFPSIVDLLHVTWPSLYHYHYPHTRSNIFLFSTSPCLLLIIPLFILLTSPLFPSLLFLCFRKHFLLFLEICFCFYRLSNFRSCVNSECKFATNASTVPFFILIHN